MCGHKSVPGHNLHSFEELSSTLCKHLITVFQLVVSSSVTECARFLKSSGQLDTFQFLPNLIILLPDAVCQCLTGNCEVCPAGQTYLQVCTLVWIDRNVISGRYTGYKHKRWKLLVCSRNEWITDAAPRTSGIFIQQDKHWTGKSNDSKYTCVERYWDSSGPQVEHKLSWTLETRIYYSRIWLIPFLSCR